MYPPRYLSRRALALAAVTTCFVAASLGAHAQNPDCTSLPRAVIGAGGSASKPLIGRLAGRLAALQDPDRITLIYQSPGACFGITPYLAGGSPLTGTASYWDGWDGTGNPVEHTCQLPVTGLAPDFGMMGTSALLCEGVTALPAGIQEFPGPITSWSLIVPTISTETSISAEAAYFVYGFGPESSQADPWTVRTELKGRSATSAALIAIALAIGVPPERMAGNTGTDERTNQQMITSVAGSQTPNAALGFVSSEVADLNRATVRTLAYQHYDQVCGFLPDTTLTAVDKANVRDGHYYLWSAYRFYAPSAGGVITDADTRAVVGYFTGAEPLPAGVPLNEDLIRNGNIPECAMGVWRDSDLGALYSYSPVDHCNCYFDFVATGATSCTACIDNSACTTAGETCRHGYCEE
jgi:hypothetical protein